MSKSREELELEFKVNKINLGSQSDWDQNNSASASFVKNRVCYEETLFDSDSLQVMQIGMYDDEVYPFHYIDKVFTKDDIVGLTVAIDYLGAHTESVISEVIFNENFVVVDGHVSLGNPDIALFWPIPYTQWHLDNIESLSVSMQDFCYCLHLNNCPFGTYMFDKTEIEDTFISLHISKSDLKQIDSKFIPANSTFDVVLDESGDTAVFSSGVFTHALVAGDFVFKFDTCNVSKSKGCHYFGLISCQTPGTLSYKTADGEGIDLCPNIEELEANCLYSFDAFVVMEMFMSWMYVGSIVFTKLKSY